MRKIWIRGVVMLICLLSLHEGIAQSLSQHNWYFGGTNRGIRFNRTDNSASLVTNKATPFGTGGSAVASDPTNANVQFYTDGSRVYNIANVQMSNGFGLSANTNANQPVAICRVPGLPTSFLIFTNTASFTAVGTISVSTVDMTAFGGEAFPTPPLGNVTTKNVATGLTGRSEAMISIPHANGTDFWLITHENGTDNYTSTLVAPGPTFTHTTYFDVTGGLTISAANFSYHEATGKIAVSPQTADDNVSILNFDNTTGAITFDQFVFNSAVSSTTNQATFDTEWSNNGQFLYISRHGEAGIPADVLQFDLNNPVTSLATVLSNPVNRSYGLQMAPDSAIYHLYEVGGVFHLGTFTNTDTVASAVIQITDVFGPLNFSGTQFPSFAPKTTNNLTVTFVTSGTCSNSAISFYPFVTPGADSLVWSFGDGQVSNQWSPIHTYLNGGTFNAEVMAYLNGDTASFNLNLNITQFNLQLTLVQDTTACECELPVNNGIPPCPNDTSDDFNVDVTAQGGVGTLTYTWSNGDFGDTLTPDSAGYYYVVVTDSGVPGCTAYAGINIREYDAQDQRANIWYFGSNAGIDFNNPPGIRPITGPVDTPEGVAVISDRNGQVVFSTDGVRVYNRNDVEIPLTVPPGIGGEQGATQSSLIIPVPGDETLYYIFTTQEVHGSHTYELRYSLYDIKMNGGNGGLSIVNQLLFAPSTERITGNANWLIAHEYGNNSFRAYPISTLGIGNPVISSIGSDHVFTDAYNGQGYMKLGPSNMLAVALPSFNTSNFLEFFDFDNASGAITNFRSVNLNATAQQVYGIEFVGNKIFATLRGTSNSFLREMYIDFEGNPALIPAGAASGPFGVELGAIQLGPDGQVYVAVNNSSSLGIIQVNGDTLQLSTLNLSGFALSGGTSGLGLPNFIQNVGTATQPAGMLISGLCEGFPTNFAGSGTDPIDQFLWSFGDGFSSDSAVVQHTYPIVGSATTYVVTLRVTNRCGLDTLLTQNITIYPPPAPPTFLPPGVPQAVICNGPLTLEAEPAPGTAGYTYLWTTGETTRTVLVSRTMNIGVTITSAQGCVNNGTMIVADNRPQVNLGPDQTVCQNTPVANLNAQNPAATISWFINGVLTANTTPIQPVNTTAPPSIEYRVQILDPITLCVNRDTILFTIAETPVYTALASNTSGCGTNDGQIDLEILSPASLFTYTIAGIASGTSILDVDQAPNVPLSFTPLPGDTYVITVGDQISGCATTSTVSITDGAFTITSVVRQNNCDPLVLRVDHTANPNVAYTYNVIDAVSGTIVDSGIPALPSAFFLTNPVPSGNYIIQMLSPFPSPSPCSFSTAPQAFTQDPPVATDLTGNPCVNPVTLIATGGGAGATYVWSGPGVVNVNAANTTATPPAGSQEFFVTIGEPGFCPGTDSVTLFIETLVADFTQSDACQDIVTLTATPTGTYTYQWAENGTPFIGGATVTVNPAQNGNTFSLIVQSTVTGCLSPQVSKPVAIFGDLILGMTTTLPCEGPLPFTLTGTSNLPGTSLQWGVNGSDIPGATQPTLNRTTEGLYRLTGTLPGCTPESIEQQIVLLPATAGSLPGRALICPDPANPNPDTREILLDAGSGFTSYAWSYNGVPSSNTSQTFLATVEGTYHVDLVNSYGCPSSDETDVVEECNPRIVAPTAFRPGSALMPNSTFYVFTYFVSAEDFQLFIFNRWGELIFQANGLDPETSNQSMKWNGGYNNNAAQLLPAGTYSYVVRYKSSYRPQDGVKEERGGVVLMR